MPEDDEQSQNINISDENKIEILLERYKESWNETRLIHDFQWKSMTIVTTTVTAIMALIVIHHELVFALFPFSLAIIILGLMIIIKDREPFLRHIVIISRIEKLLGMHNVFPQFADKSLLPEEYTKITKLTFKEYIKKQKWKKWTLFSLLVLFYCILIIAVVAVSIYIIISPVLLHVNGG